MDSDPVTVTLTHDEALILFEFLARNEDRFSVVDQAEEKTLWRLHGQLEKRLVEMFLPNYRELVQAARDRLRDPDS